MSNFETLWNAACQAPLSTGFSRQEYWSGLPYLSPGDLPNPGIKPTSLTSPALVGRFLSQNSDLYTFSRKHESSKAAKKTRPPPEDQHSTSLISIFLHTITYLFILPWQYLTPHLPRSRPSLYLLLYFKTLFFASCS